MVSHSLDVEQTPVVSARGSVALPPQPQAQRPGPVRTRNPVRYVPVRTLRLGPSPTLSAFVDESQASGRRGGQAKHVP